MVQPRPSFCHCRQRGCGHRDVAGDVAVDRSVADEDEEAGKADGVDRPADSRLGGETTRLGNCRRRGRGRGEDRGGG